MDEVIRSLGGGAGGGVGPGLLFSDHSCFAPEKNWDGTGNRRYMAAEIYFSSGHNERGCLRPAADDPGVHLFVQPRTGGNIGAAGVSCRDGVTALEKSGTVEQHRAVAASACTSVGPAVCDQLGGRYRRTVSLWRNQAQRGPRPVCRQRSECCSCGVEASDFLDKVP